MSIVHTGIQIAEQSNIPEEQFLKELAEYIQSPECTLSPTHKEEFMSFSTRRQFELFRRRSPKGEMIYDDIAALLRKQVFDSFNVLLCPFHKKSITK